MAEQWFLDLDGVRSGPYQTSEVMSLIAEGEILPHHLIASELKSPKWNSILEWRLTQNKINPPKADPAPISPIQEIKINEVKLEKPITPAENNPLPEFKAEAVQPTPAAPISPKESAPPSNPPQKSGSKRDPMVDMFDIIQTTKQKREAKSQHAHAQAAAHTTPIENKVKAKSNLGKTIGIAAGVTIVGFALGQLFQQQKKNESIAPSTTIQSSPISASASPSAKTSEVEAAPAEEVLDRSTDKITIKAKVPVRSAETHEAEASATPIHPDLEELKDLKKELQELRALKDEIRNGDSPSMDPNNNNGNPNHPTIKRYHSEDEIPDPQNADGNNPNFNENGENDASGDENVHY